MLWKATVTKAQGVKATGLVRSSTGTSMVLNANRVYHARTRSTTKSKFNYVFNRYDRREKASYFETDSATSAIVTAADATFQSNMTALSYYPNNDSTKTAVTTYIPSADFALGILDGASSDRSWVWYSQGAYLKKILVAHDLDDLVDLFDTGTSTTSTTSS